MGSLDEVREERADMLRLITEQLSKPGNWAATQGTPRNPNDLFIKEDTLNIGIPHSIKVIFLTKGYWALLVLQEDLLLQMESCIAAIRGLKGSLAGCGDQESYTLMTSVPIA